MDSDEYRELARESIAKYSRRPPDAQVLDKLLEQVRYVPGTFDDDSVFERLGGARQVRRGGRDRVQPHLLPLDGAGFFALIIDKLGEHGLHSTRTPRCAW